jgi:hypothetical protein
MKTYRGSGGIFPVVLNPGTNARKWPASRPAAVHPSRYVLSGRMGGLQSWP